MPQGGPAVTIVLAGGLPVTQLTAGGGTPFTVLLAGGMPITLVDAQGLPFALYDETGATYTTNVAPTLVQNPVVTNDLTPDFDTSLTAPVAGDSVSWRWSTVSNFATVTGTGSHVLSAGEASGLSFSFTISPALTDRAAWYFQDRHNSSAWSNTVTVVVETAAPTLTSPTDVSTGTTTGTGTVSTNEGQGTLYWVLSSATNTPTAQQVREGKDHTGTPVAAGLSGSQAVTATGTQTVSFTGLTLNTTYYANYEHSDPTPNHSTVSHADGFTTDNVVDTTAPTLTNPVDTATGSSTGSGSVDTDEANGTLYWVVTARNTAPSKTQIKNHQDDLGSTMASGSYGSPTVTGTGTQNITITGLTASTTYYAYFMHEDAATNQSNVASGNGLTTTALSSLLLEDGSSHLTLEDGTSRILME